MNSILVTVALLLWGMFVALVRSDCWSYALTLTVGFTLPVSLDRCPAAGRLGGEEDGFPL